MYDWKCSKCGGKVAVLRTFDDYQVPPGAEDESGIKLLEEVKKKRKCKHKWERVIGSGSVVRGPGWGLGKGYWGSSW